MSVGACLWLILTFVYTDYFNVYILFIQICREWIVSPDYKGKQVASKDDKV